MPEWLCEEGIGENRAVLIEDGEIVEASIELPGPHRPGAIVRAKLIRVQQPGRRGVVRLADDAEALLAPIPPGITEGATLNVEIIREPLPDSARLKRAKVRPAYGPARPAPNFVDRLHARPHPLAGPDRFEQAGWSELLEQALTGAILFPGGSLHMSLTPAMTLFDVDGTLEPAALAVAGARAAGLAIRRFGIGGSIGIDLPTLAAKTERQAAAAALDAVLPQPFERTAVNGFGFLQVVRRRDRRSLPEILQADPAGAAARALLRRAERSGPGPLALTAAPDVIAQITPEWRAALERRTGGGLVLRADAALSISAGHVHRPQS